MKWTPAYLGGWHRHFVWRPISLNTYPDYGDRVWLGFVWRKWAGVSASGTDKWLYRVIKSANGPKSEYRKRLKAWADRQTVRGAARVLTTVRLVLMANDGAMYRERIQRTDEAIQAGLAELTNPKGDKA